MSSELGDKMKDDYINLVSPKVGSEVVYATDDFFADKSRLIQDSDPIFIDDKYDDHGKWMDGWESRRRRDGGYDYAIIRLGVKGVIKGVSIDTSYFTGNYPPKASLEACLSAEEPTEDSIWTEIVVPTSLGPDSEHFIQVSDDRPYNWLRLNIFPDGGIARLRVYGEAYCAWETKSISESYELSAIANGGRIVSFNNAHYGNTWSLLCAGRGENMGDGWETRRRRKPGNDWIIIALGTTGTIENIELDTAYFKGNYPDRFSLEAVCLEDGADATQTRLWKELLPQQKLSADAQHYYADELVHDFGPVNHIRISIYPDGGVSRFRAFGKMVRDD